MRVTAGLAALLWCLGPVSSSKAQEAQKKGVTTLVWLSMDGLRADYLDRAPLPFFHRMMSEGAYSRRFIPVFPPITFPSHCAEATGVPVERHGITGNVFYDSAPNQTYKFPPDSALLQAEPIWLAAARQGVRTAVFDWPLSQAEHGEVRAQYSLPKFDGDLSDTERLDNLLATWRSDDADRGDKPPLRLIMGYIEGTDPVGHRAGPDSALITDAMVTLDAELETFQRRVLALWQTHATPDDQLYFLLTTDHGMSKVEHVVNLERELGIFPRQPDVKVQTVGNMGNVFALGTPPGPNRDARLEAWTRKLAALPGVRVYRRETLPPEWHYAHPTRTGDLVVVLPKGSTFDRLLSDSGDKHDAPKGMHGYPVEDDPEMQGVTFLWRYPKLIGGKDLGPVRWDQLHPTAAMLLGIEPARGAKGQAIEFEKEETR